MNQILDLDVLNTIRELGVNINTTYLPDTVYKLIAVINMYGKYLGEIYADRISTSQYSICIKYLNHTIPIYFEFDVHHGNGTQSIFYNKSNVYYSSIHTFGAYPQTGLANETGTDAGLGYNLNVVVPKNTTTEEYIIIFRTTILQTIYNYNPDLILISAGFDGLATDPTAIMKLTPDCYSVMMQDIVDYNKLVPVMMVLEGGYNADVETCIRNCVEILAS